MIFKRPAVFAPLDAPARYKASSGGRSSGKSHDAAYRMIIRHATVPGALSVCVREIQKSLSQSVKRLLEDKIKALGLTKFFRSTKTEIHTPGDGIIIFMGMQNHTAETVKSLEGFTVCWAEEAQTLSTLSLRLLRPTFRFDGAEIWFTYNPRFALDPVALFVDSGYEDMIHVKANLDDNPLASKIMHDERAFDYKNDPVLAAHVWGGEYLKNARVHVFSDYEVMAFDSPTDRYRQFYYGLDFGYSIDPTAAIRCFLDPDESKRTLYIDYDCSKTGVEIDKMPAFLARSMPEVADWPITADGARPEIISYLKRSGLKIKPAKKGKNSVMDGVKWLQSYHLVIHPRCKDTIKEVQSYKFKTRNNGNEDDVLPILEDKNNHLIDALRYAVEQLRKGVSMQDVL